MKVGLLLIQQWFWMCINHTIGPQLQHNNQYRLSEPPMNLSHKRIIDEMQGGPRDMWKNESPVSVTARIFRPTPSLQQQQQQQQQHQHQHQQQHSQQSRQGDSDVMLGNSGSPMGIQQSPMMHQADAFKPSVPLYRPAPASHMGQGHFGGMDQVWADACL